MSAPAFTPGPWVLQETPESSHQDWIVTARALIGGGRRTRVASVDFQHAREEIEANARLIAAAPVMYVALVKAAETFADFADALRLLHHDTAAQAADLAEQHIRAAMATATDAPTCEET